MPTSRSLRLVLLVGAVATIGLGAGCSKSPDAVSVGTTVPGSTAAPPADAASAGGKKASCDPAELVPVIQKKYASAGVDHLVCLVPNAILTVKTGGDDTVVFLVQRDGLWVVGVDGPTAEAEKLLPKDFPLTMLRSWEDKRTPGAPTDPARPSTTKRPKLADGEVLVCTGEGGDAKCVTSTAPKPTTTRPPTTPPPVTEPPTTAPPTSTPPTTFSQFCLENPLDPSCSGKK